MKCNLFNYRDSRPDLSEMSNKILKKGPHDNDGPSSNKNVYILHVLQSDIANHYKVGVTNNINRRIRDLNKPGETHIKDDIWSCSHA